MTGIDNLSLSFIQKNAQERKWMITHLKQKAISSRTSVERIADVIARNFGSVSFLFSNVIFFVVWIIINLGCVPQITPFDPFPFGLLTMMVSLEAILLTIFVLISQTSLEKYWDIQENIDLFYEIYTEAEITKLVELTKLIAEKNGIKLDEDEELREIQKPINIEEIKSMFEAKLLDNQNIPKNAGAEK